MKATGLWAGYRRLPMGYRNLRNRRATHTRVDVSTVACGAKGIGQVRARRRNCPWAIGNYGTFLGAKSDLQPFHHGLRRKKGAPAAQKKSGLTMGYRKLRHILRLLLGRRRFSGFVHMAPCMLLYDVVPQPWLT